MTAPYYADDSVTLWLGDALDVLRGLPDASVDCCVTSPPYFGLRDYGTGRWVGGDESCSHSSGRGSNVPQTKNPNVSYAPSAHRGANPRECVRCGAVREDQQYGLEASPAEYVETMRALFAEVRRVLADDGTLWLNLGDSYSSEPPGRSEHAMRASTLNGKARAGKMRESVRSAGVDKTKFVPRKNMLGMPWLVAFALQGDGWVLRNDIIWAKPNAMPESVTDRLSSRHEHLFMFSKSPRYWFDLDPIREPLARPEALSEGIVFGGTSPDVGRRRGSTYGDGVSRRDSFARATKEAVVPGQSTAQHREGRPNVAAGTPLGRNPGDVWTIATQPFSEAHFAVMPQALAERAILAGCRPGGVVLDPFSGSGTTGLAATKHGRRYVGIDLSRDYLDLSLRTRLAQAALDFGEPA